MNDDRNTRRLKTAPYGWFVLAGAFAVLFLVQGSRSIIGVAFKPIIEEFEWSRSAFSLVLFVHMAIFALMLPLVGRFFDRYGGKWIVIVSSLSLSVGYMGITVTQSLGLFLVLYGLLAAIGFGGCSITLFAAVASKWFHRNRGLAISLALAGGPVGQFVMVPPATHVIHTYGWRWVFIGLAILIIAVNLFVALTVMGPKTRRADKRHQRPTDVQSRMSDFAPYHSRASEDDLNLRQAIKTRSFWLFTILMAVCGAGDYLMITHLVPMVTDKAVSAQTAGSMMAWFGLMAMAGLMVTGPAVDKFGNKLPIVATFAMRIVILIMILCIQNVTTYFIFALMFGFTMFITAPITTTLTAKLYGMSHIGLVSGIVTTVHHFSGGLCAFLGGVTFDRTGSYDLIFGIYAGLCAVALICGAAIKEKKHRLANPGCHGNI